jgi:tetratricopeptide (TPR) repeat protein
MKHGLHIVLQRTFANGDRCVIHDHERMEAYMSRKILRHLVSPALLVLSACGTGDGAQAQDAPEGEVAHAQHATAGVPLYDNLGTHHFEVTTSAPAQRYFDQGMRLYYAFNHAEAIRAFDEAARLDPNCAMCYWGRALALGPNINVPMDSASGAAAYAAVREAIARQAHASPSERALIDALSQRYVEVPPAERSGLDSLYARAMERVAAQFPKHPEVLALYAEALMDLSPWRYWNRDGSPRPDTPALLKALETVIAAQPEHPGANHFFIHAVEAVDPERAVPMAENLAGLMPGAGHLVHMPGHIYIRVGRYEDAIRANEHAVHADETFITDHKPDMGVYTLGYYPHNYDFLAFAASMIGRSAQALDAADRMAALVKPELLGAPGLTALQKNVSRGLQLRVRFGRWEEILQAREPAAAAPYARAIWHFARGRAFAARGDVKTAVAELERLRNAASDGSLQDTPIEFNPATALLAIAANVLDGHIAAARGDFTAAIELLTAAAATEDELVYGEPPEWSVPVRHELGNVLLEAGRADEAEAAFRDDLRRFPGNGWSLDGLSRSLTAQGRESEAAAVRARFAESWKSADVQITGK